MKKSLISCTLIPICFLFNLAKADIEFAYIIKEKEYSQTENTAPTTPQGWLSAAGVSGDGLVTGATVTYPGSGGPINMPGADGEYELDSDDQEYLTQAALDAAFPNGNVSLSITDNGSMINLGPFALTGDAYPITPHIENAVEFKTSDLLQNFTLNWNAFSGSNDGDQVLVQIWDNTNDNDLLMEFLDRSATSFVIPGGTLVADRNYDLNITFINQTAASPPGVDAIIGYLTTTQVEISTFPNVSEPSDVLVSRGVSTTQTSAAAPTELSYGFLVEAFGSDFSSVTLIKPDTSEVIVPSSGPAEFDLDAVFSTEGERDAAYPEGVYSVRVINNGESITLGPVSQTGGTLPVIPWLTNWETAQVINPDEGFNLLWNTFSNAVPGALIEVEIWNNNDPNNETDFTLDSFSDGVFLSSDFLQPNASYTGEIIFINPAISPQMINGVLVNSYYEVFTTFTFQTDPGGGGFANDSAYLLFKRDLYEQSGPGVLNDAGYGVLARATGNSNSISSVAINNFNAITSLNDLGDNSFFLGTPYNTKGELDTVFPAGDFWVDLIENGEAVGYGPYNLPPDDYPVAPMFSNFSDLQTFDPGSPLTVNWGAAPGTVSTVLVYALDGDTIEWIIALPGTDTSVQLPANTLTADRTYNLTVQFRAPKNTATNPTAVAGYISQTSMTVQTSSGGGGGGNDPGIDFIYIIKELAFDQFENFAPDESNSEWSFGAGVSGGSNVTGATVSYVGSGGPINLPGEPGDYELDDDTRYSSQAAMDAQFPNGSVSFSVTEDGNTSNLGPFTISGDSYPNAPHILNAVALRSYDFSQPFTVQWNEFEGATSEDRIVIQIWRNDDDEELLFEFLASTATSFEIPANTLQLNKHYELDIIFVKETDGLASPDTIIGYLTTTRIDISTWPAFNSSPDLEVFMSKGTAAVQTSSEAPGPQQWFYFVEAEVSGITTASITIPGGSTIPVPASTDETGLVEFEAIFGNEAELDTAYPDGNYSMDLIINGIPTKLESLTMGGGSPANQPYFTNFDSFQQADPSLPLTFEWAGISSPPPNARLSLEIEGAPGYNDLDVDLPGVSTSSTSGVLSANTLEPNSKYFATLFYEIPSYTSGEPDVFVGYEVLTQAAFWTTDASVGPVAATNLIAAIESETSVRLDWTDNSDTETGFRIERKAIWENDWTSLASLGTNTNSYVDNTVNLGEAYLYRVVAFDAADDGARSNEAQVQIAPPADPTELAVDPYNSDTLTLSWDDNSEGESGFEIDRSTDGNSWDPIGTTGANENIYIDSGLDDDSTFIYRVRALSALGSSDASAPDSDSTYQATTGKPINISTRGTVGGTDDSIMIAGFIITGTENKDIYITGIAPSLVLPSSPPLLQDPELVLFDGAGAQLDTNDDWQDNPRSADIIATTLAPKNEKEAALYVNLAPGVYTVWMRGADAGTGVGLVEVYEANPDNEARLINISTRGIVGSGDGLMIAGIIVKGTGNRTLYIRGNGPSLPDNLTDRLSDTTLEMLDASGQRIAFNDNWRDNENFASIIATTIQPGFIEEAALLVNVPASPSGTAYTIALRGANDTEGLAIIEVFEVPDN